MPLAYTASGSGAIPPHSYHHHQHQQHSNASLLTSVQNSSGSSQNTNENPRSTIYHTYHHYQSQRQLQQPFSTATKSSSSISDALLLALRRRPAARLFRALFQYIPIRDSPNENPQLELPLQVCNSLVIVSLLLPLILDRD